ncbi:Rz1 family lipoprotein [Pantoea sp. F_11]
MICSAMLTLAVSGCSSTQTAPPCQRVNPPAPPAWLMQPAPDLLTPLGGIISPSGSASKQPDSR